MLHSCHICGIWYWGESSSAIFTGFRSIPYFCEEGTTTWKLCTSQSNGSANNMCLCIKVCLCDLWLVRLVYVQKTFPMSVPAHLSASWSDIGRHRWLSIACILGRKLDKVIFYRIASLLQFYKKKNVFWNLCFSLKRRFLCTRKDWPSCPDYNKPQ